VINKWVVDLFEQRRIFTVAELTADIKRTLDALGILWVQGELSNFKHHSSGHMYFTLKDEKAQLKAACFRNSNQLLRFRPSDGLKVLARGRLSVYEPRGDYQLIVEYMEPMGVGSLQLAFEQLKEKLRKEGLFDDAHKTPIPRLPRKIGIVTSPTGAAIRDMLRVLKRRNSSLHVLLFPVKVQGAGAAEEIAAAIRHLNSREDLDVIIAGRGGGSIEDLWAFNEEVVARAIFESRIPIISAVGHEVDFTISDFVADLRAATPSVAAELVSGSRDELLATVRSLEGRLVQAMLSGIQRRRLTLERLSRSRAFSVAPTMVRALQQRFDEATLHLTNAAARYLTGLVHRRALLDTRLCRIDLAQLVARRREFLGKEGQRLFAAARSKVRRERSRFETVAAKLDVLSPLAILDRGYAICRDQERRILKEAAAVSPGASVDVRLARGELHCRVDGVSVE